MRKRLICCIAIMTVALFSLCAIEIEDVSYAFNALYNGTFCAVAANSTVPRIELPGVSVEETSSDSLTYKLSYNRSDLAQFTTALKGESADSWYSKLLKSARSTFSPLLVVATQQIEGAQYIEGDAVLDGTMKLIFPSKSALSSWIDLLVLSDWSSICFTLEVSIVVSGNAMGEAMAFEGVLEGKGVAGERSVELSVKQMLCNETAITMKPIKLGLK